MDSSTILVLEDSREVRDLVTEILDDDGFRVTACGDADEARAWLCGHRPDLVVLDARLPHTSGMQFFRELRASRRHATLPVVFLTAAEKDVRQAIDVEDEDCVDLVTKPFDIDAFRAAVERLIADPACE